MLILISINVQCLQNVVFSFEKGSNSQDSSSSDSYNPIKNFLYSKIINCSHLGEFPPTPEHYLVKTWISHLHHKRISGEKMTKVKIIFLYLLCNIMLKKNLHSRSWNIRLNNFEANWTQIYHMPIKVLFGVARLFYH